MKTAAILAVAIMTLSLFTALVVAEDDEDSSDYESHELISPLSSPTEIRTLEDLDNIRNDLDGHYVLMSDINASATSDSESEFWNDGAGWVPVDDFRGQLDGNGHNISGLFIDRPSSDFIGLFGTLAPGAAVFDVGLLEAEVKGKAYVGTLVGYNNDGSITNCHASVDVGGNNHVGGLVGNNKGAIFGSSTDGDVSSLSNAGGLIGRNYGEVAHSNSNVDVGESRYIGGLIGVNIGTVYQSYASGKAYGDRSVGGLVGENRDEIRESYATGNVSSDSNMGGLVGINHGKVTESYASSDVKGGSYGGGLVGVNHGLVSQSYATGVVGVNLAGGLVADNYCTVAKSYWDVETSSMKISSGGMGRTTEEMMQQSTFLDWDFAGVWWIYEGLTYPQLRTPLNTTIDAMPDRTEYDFGEALDLTGMTVNIISSDGTSEVLPWDSQSLSVEPKNGTLLNHENTVVTVTYYASNENASLNIVVNAVVFEVVISQQPKLGYDHNDELDLSAMAANLTMSDGSWSLVQFEDFETNHLSVSLAHGTSLTEADHHGVVVEVSHVPSGQSDDTEALSVVAEPVDEPPTDEDEDIDADDDICPVPLALMLVFGMSAIMLRRR